VSVEDYTEPILAGEGASDYERYLRTDELRSLQRWPEEQAHRDELLFQTVHQASERCLKQRFCPELWQARNRLTELANEEE
jgi:tryptophan 2,3-dioxygenase